MDYHLIQRAAEAVSGAKALIDECHRGSAAEDSAWREILVTVPGVRIMRIW